MKQHRNGSILWITVFGLVFVISICFLLLVGFCFCILRRTMSLVSNQVGRIFVRGAERVGDVGMPCVEGMKMIN